MRTVAEKTLSQMRVEKKKNDLRLGFSVLGLHAYSLADSNRVSRLRSHLDFVLIQECSETMETKTTN